MTHKFITFVLTILMIVCSISSTDAQQITVGWTKLGPDLEKSFAFIRDYLIPNFEMDSGISVDFLTIDGPALMQEFAGGQGPDIVLTWRDLGLSSSWHDFLIPLDPFLARWEDSKYIPEWLLRRSHNDRYVYALPFHNNLYGVYAYHKGAFAETGLDPSAPPQSWEQLLEAIKRLTGTNRTGLDMIQWTAEQTFVSYLYQNGGRMWSDNSSEILFHGQKGTEALQFMAELYQASHPPEEAIPSRISHNVPFTRFSADLANGDLAIFMSYSSSLAQFSDLQQLDYFVGRRSPAHDAVVVAEPYGLAISKFSRNPADAWRFIEWFFKPENTMRYHHVTNTLATRLDMSQWVEEYTPGFRHLYQYTSHAMLQPRLETISYNWYAHDSDWQSVLTGQIEGETPLTELGSMLQRQIDQLND